MKNNLEEVLKEKMSIDMSSPIKFLRTMRLSHYEIPGDFVLDMHDQLDELEQELQKTREQLEKAQSFISDFKDIFEQEKDDTILSELDDLWFNYNRNFKDKQGE
jgi:hypothetical protein